jgi:hypothetical protein
LDLLIAYRWYLQLIIPLFLIFRLLITLNIPKKKVFRSHFKSSHGDEISSSRHLTHNSHFQPRTGFILNSQRTTLNITTVALYSLRTYSTENSASIVETCLPSHCIATVAALTAANSLLRCLLPSNEQHSYFYCCVPFEVSVA